MNHGNDLQTTLSSVYLTVPQNFSNDFAKSTSLGSVSTCSFNSFESEETSDPATYSPSGIPSVGSFEGHQLSEKSKPGPRRRKCVWCSLSHGHRCRPGKCEVAMKLGWIGSNRLLKECRDLRSWGVAGDLIKAALIAHGEGAPAFLGYDKWKEAAARGGKHQASSHAESRPIPLSSSAPGHTTLSAADGLFALRHAAEQDDAPSIPPSVTAPTVFQTAVYPPQPQPQPQQQQPLQFPYQSGFMMPMSSSLPSTAAPTGPLFLDNSTIQLQRALQQAPTHHLLNRGRGRPKKEAAPAPVLISGFPVPAPVAMNSMSMGYSQQSPAANQQQTYKAGGVSIRDLLN